MVSDRQIRKYFTKESQKTLSMNEMRDIFARGRSDYALCGGCDTLKEFVEANEEAPPCLLCGEYIPKSKTKQHMREDHATL